MRAALATSVLLLAVLVGACGSSGPSAGDLAEQEPEEALAGMEGVADVGREYDVAEDDFYVNEVVVDAEPDVSVDELVAILDVMSFYEGLDEPVGGTVYLDAGTTDWSPDTSLRQTALINEPGSEQEQAARVERFLLAARELDGVIALVSGDSLLVRTYDQGPVGVAEAAAQILDGDLAESGEIQVTTLGESTPGDFSLSLGGGFGERNLSAWLELISAPLGGKAELESLRIGPPEASFDDAAVEACIRTAPFKEPDASELTPANYADELAPFTEALGRVQDDLGAAAVTSAYVDARGQFISCDPYLEIDEGGEARDPGDRGWDAVAKGGLRER